MVVNVAYNCLDPNIGLTRTTDYSKRKVFFGDTGLLVTQIFNDSNVSIQNSIYKQLILDKLAFNYGIVMENGVAQALTFSGHNLFFYRFDRHEIDFLLVEGKKLIPIEVKSSSYKSYRSLDMFKEKYRERIKKSYVIYRKNLKKDKDIIYIPFYMTMFL